MNKLGNVVDKNKEGDAAQSYPPSILKLLQDKAQVRLDIGCGESKQRGFIGIDILPLDGVDIVWDLENTPWPLPDESVDMAIASHVLEHINPHKGVFINVMNEIWRILKVNGQFAFVVPYAESFGMYQDPTHCNFINEATMDYFDPFAESGLYGFYRPKPWKIITQPFSRTGVLECLLEKRPDDKSYHKFSKPSDITREKLNAKSIKTIKYL